jgi:hypothetical protein
VSKEGGGIVVVVVVGADIVVGVVGLWPSSMPLTEYMQFDFVSNG